MSDHDILITLKRDMKYVVDGLKDHSRQIEFLTKQNQCRKDWQDDRDIKEKFIIAVASTIGAFLMFVAGKIVDFFLSKRV